MSIDIPPGQGRRATFRIAAPAVVDRPGVACILRAAATGGGRVTEQASFFASATPSFAPVGAADGRIAVIDVGSNSVRLVVFEEAARAPAYFFNEKVACGLGAEIARTGRLAPEGRRAALATLTRFAALAERMKVAALDAVATAAVREAADGPAFRDEVERATGLRLRVIDGDEEARLSAMGVLLGEPRAEGAMSDMGGASMELAALERGPGGAGEVGRRVTLALGPQRLDGLTGPALRRRIDDELARGVDAAPVAGRALYLVGGAWRAFAKLQMTRARHPLQVLHGHRFAPAEALETAAWVAEQPPEALKGFAELSGGRAATAPLAAAVLAGMIERLAPPVLTVSAFGLREGLYFERLPATLRAHDPLIAAARRLEQAQARFPGFGDELWSWVAPLFADWDKRERRLARAACLLNDVNWRAHPDYRAVGCFEIVTRANLAGLDHADRVFIGFALMNRYGGGRRSADVEEALALIAPGPRARAKALGRALRLGAMLSASTPGALAETRLESAGGEVRLGLGGAVRALSGEAVERRLGALADGLGLAPRLIA
jgi:exopolyphosphatase/guanosine-5'-triphosphate,3'-diphosphate pyrophosphatase